MIRKHARRGFTIVEVMIVLAIILDETKNRKS